MLVVVTGPPCVGKSTYVDTHAQHGDIVIDLDRLALALTTRDTGHHDYDEHIRYIARCARHAALTAALEAHHAGCMAWVVDAAPSTAQRARYHRNGATFVNLTESDEVLAERARQRPPRNQALIAALTQT